MLHQHTRLCWLTRGVIKFPSQLQTYDMIGFRIQGIMTIRYMGGPDDRMER